MNLPFEPWRGPVVLGLSEERQAVRSAVVTDAGQVHASHPSRARVLRRHHSDNSDKCRFLRQPGANSRSTVQKYWVGFVLLLPWGAELRRSTVRFPISN